MRFLTVLALVLSTSAFASEYVSRKLSFSPMTSTGGGSYHYYNCDSAEDNVEATLEKLGAVNIKVRCSGGIGPGSPWPMPIHVSGSFDAPVPAGNDAVETVVLQGRDNCSFMTELVDKVVPMFPGVTVVSRRANCWSGRINNWKYTLQVTH